MMKVESRPLIGVALAAGDPFEELEPLLETLDAAGCPYHIQVVSIWVEPHRLLRWAEQAEQLGCRVLVATAGTQPHLPGLLASACRLPVLAVPLEMATPEEVSIRIAVQTSPQSPVAAVGPGEVVQAAHLALRILGTADPRWLEPIEQNRDWARNELAEQNEAFHGRDGSAGPMASGWDSAGKPASEDATAKVRPYHVNKPLDEPRRDEATAETGAPAASKTGARVIGRRAINPEEIDVFLIEEAVDCLLEGGLIALPTETVYGLAADATNPAAIERLFQIKERAPGKAITLMVDSPKMLAGIARNLTVEARCLMEAFWPGPLTIVFQKRSGNFDHISTRETIGVRMPDHAVPLAIVQELARPLACTSANLSGRPEASSADELERTLGDQLNLILDAGELPERAPSTVIDLTAEPYQILRQGDIGIDQIATIIGDKLQREP